MATKVSTDFYDHEFVPPEVYFDPKKINRLYISNWQIEIAQYFRDYFGTPVTINNYFFGGQYKESGTRLHNTPTGAKLSMHKYCLALDLKLKGMTANEVRAEILKNEQEFLKMGVTRIENGSLAPTWVHIDHKFTGLDKIVVFG